jgi:hypothetical protein
MFVQPPRVAAKASPKARLRSADMKTKPNSTKLKTNGLFAFRGLKSLLTPRMAESGDSLSLTHGQLVKIGGYYNS